MKILADPSYFIFRKEFCDVVSSLKNINRELRHILVTVRGGDLYSVRTLDFFYAACINEQIS
jgi:hypothetical protein